MFEEVPPEQWMMLSGLLFAAILTTLIFEYLGILSRIWSKLFQKAGVKTNVVIKEIPPSKRPRIMYRDGSFDQIIKHAKVVGKDPSSGKDLLKFFYIDGDEEKETAFTVPDDPTNIRYVGSFIDFITKDQRQCFDVITDDIVNHLQEKKISAELQSKATLEENRELRGSIKVQSKEFAEHYNSMKKGMFGVYGQPQQNYGSSPFLGSWRNRYNPNYGGGGGGEGIDDMDQSV